MSDKILSAFIDESGDFGTYSPHSPYYIVSIVTHNQDIDINRNIKIFEEHVQALGYDGDTTVHTGPLIRREAVYSNDLMEERKRLFNALFNFARKLDINYACAKTIKSKDTDIIKLTANVSREIGNTIRMNIDYWNSFDKIIIYYDNGQIELTKILTSVFNTLLTNVEFRRVSPHNYKLFQVADMICTIELLALKADSNSFSKSETEFFGNIRNFKKNYLKPILKKCLK